MQWSHWLVCWTPSWCGLCWSLEAQPGHCVSSLGKDSLAPYILLPRSSNGHQRKAKGNPTILMNVKFHGGREVFTLFHSFHSSQETGIQDGYGNARRQSFDSVRIKLAKTNWISLRLCLRDFSFRGSKLFLFLLFPSVIHCSWILLSWLVKLSGQLELDMRT